MSKGPREDRRTEQQLTCPYATVLARSPSDAPFPFSIRIVSTTCNLDSRRQIHTMNMLKAVNFFFPPPPVDFAKSRQWAEGLRSTRLHASLRAEVHTFFRRLFRCSLGLRCRCHRCNQLSVQGIRLFNDGKTRRGSACPGECQGMKIRKGRQKRRKINRRGTH